MFLALEGRIGTEKLWMVLNLYFSKMLDIIEQYGGDVIKFAGDALQV
jgi:class 3 adenylate cyclase